MNESCPAREREGTVVCTAEYRLMFSYCKGGNVGETEGEIEPKDGRNEGQMMTEGKEDVAEQDKRDKLYITIYHHRKIMFTVHKCQNTSSTF